MGWLWSACAGLEPASLRYATQRDTSYTIGTISRFHGLSVVTRGEFTQRFRLSQAYAYIIPRIFSEKLAKFQNKKVGRSHDQPLSYALSSSSLTTLTSPY